ncbi:MAG: pilus assembly protein [Renibacterium salmoninarum]|nr:pilus assembly protein [Renibacterium salmoninarum]
MLICGLLVGWRFWTTNNGLDQVAQAAARDASLTRTAQQANQRGILSAQDWLGIRGLPCQDQNIAVDTSGYRVPLGQTGFVQVTVSCTVNFTDLFLPGFLGQVTVTKTALSAIDPYRERQ